MALTNAFDYRAIAKSYASEMDGSFISPTNVFELTMRVMSLLSDAQEETSLGNAGVANAMIDAAKVMLCDMKSAAR